MVVGSEIILMFLFKLLAFLGNLIALTMFPSDGRELFMQQQMSQQHDQMGGQQTISQQMVLCPVRFVYETQILVQPGDHIQPNQTFFINAQNPPPWMQNSLQTRQVTNPAVVYVQHLPNNIVSTVQQPIDQNQIYLQQNFGNFQLQQQMLAQNQEMRPTMQLTNIVPNMVQNIQTNVANDRNNHQNGQMQTNTQIVPVQMSRPVQNQMNQVEIQRQILMRPQIQQQNCIQRPIVSMNQVQNVQQQNINMPNSVQNHQIMSNIGRPSPNMNIVRSPVPNNVVSVQPIPKVRDSTPTEVKTVNSPLNNVVPNIRNFVPNYYRPIQPRPQNNHNVVNTPKPQHIPVQTVPSAPIYNHDRNNSQQNTNNNFTIMQQLNNPVNRKRKSESPDEVQKKMATIKQNPQIQQQSMTITKIVNEIGTNTSPVHKPKVNMQYKVNNSGNTNADSIIENIIKEAMMPVDKEKLVRNTVYTQARGRVLQDKIEEIKPQMENRIESANILENRVIENPKIDIKDESKTMEVQTMENITFDNSIVIENKTYLKEEPKLTDSVENNQKINENNILENTVNDNQEKKDVEDSKHVQIVVNYAKSPERDIAVSKEERKEREETVNKDNDPNNEGENKFNDENKEENKIIIKQENISILTHVLDGYVIQESNFAFPIRKPLKEKTLQTNLKTRETEEKDLIRESIREELKNNVDIPLLPFHYLMLDNAKEEKVEEDKVVEDKTKDNPFFQLQHTTVKSWTVNDLCNHLLKFDWKETLSLFHEHEIDGESLLLVSKQQLLTIGVKEDHADIICDFVKS